MSKRKTLGKGLNALFPDIDSVITEGKTTNLCSIEAILPNPYQPRKSFDPEKIAELVASIKTSGLIQPLVVRQRADGFELIAGERRWRAAIKAGLQEVPIVVKNVSDDQVLKLSLIENIQRENLNPVEEAEAYNQLIEKFSLSQESVAEIVGKNRSTITNTLRLARLPEKIKQDLASGKISSGHARALLALGTVAEKFKLYREILKRELSVRQTEALVKKMQNKKQPPSHPKEDVQTKHIKEKLQRLLSAQVKIVKKGGEGKIEISFFSDQDLERIIEIIRGETKVL